MTERRRSSVWVMSQDTGDINDKYTLGEKIGQSGQFGSAYRCTHKVTNKEYAVKVISKARFTANHSKNALLQFRAEIDIMKRMSHKNIISFAEVFESPAELYIVMELCLGGELFDRIQKVGHYSERDCAKLIRAVLSGLQHMHHNKVAHCDVKPDNFLFVDDAEDADIKIIDFGLSKFVPPSTYLRSFCGTPYYVAPEVLHGKFNEACDLWSVGVVCFVMLFGYPPFHANPKKYGKKTDAHIYSLVQKGFDPVVKKGYAAHFPAKIPVSESARSFISSLLKTEPADRPTTDEALMHRWLQPEGSDGAATDVPLHPSVLAGLKHFEASSRFKQAILTAMADTLAQDEVEALQATFKVLDADGDGTITIEELRGALLDKMKAHENAKTTDDDAVSSAHVDAEGHVHQAFSVASEEELNALMQKLDVDGDGVISYKELTLSCVNRKLNAKEERLWASFCKLDLDGDGSVTIDELRQVMGDVQPGITDDEIAQMVAEVDSDGDGSVDYTEFLAMMRNREEEADDAAADGDIKEDIDDDAEIAAIVEAAEAKAVAANEAEGDEI